MKSTIDEKGFLTVQAESPIELYALRQWWENYEFGAGKKRTSTTPSGISLVLNKVVKEPTKC